MYMNRCGFIGALLVIGLVLDSVVAEAQANRRELQEVVVTGSRDTASVRRIPATITVVNRAALEAVPMPNMFAAVGQAVPGLMVTSRGMLGYGVSTGAAGGLSLRGLSGSAGQMLVLIDGHPQYSSIYGHPVADGCRSMLAEKVEVLRGPSSVLYGSNAMGGVINIVTRQMSSDGSHTRLNMGMGSYATQVAEVSNVSRQGAFTSTVAAQYARSDNHRPRMDFDQQSVFVKLGYDLSDHWNVNGMVDYLHFNAQYPGSELSPIFGAQQWISRGNAALTLENHHRRSSGAISLFANAGWHTIDDGTRNADSLSSRYFRSTDLLGGLSAWQTLRLVEGNRLTVGADLQRLYGHAWYESQETGSELELGGQQTGSSARNEAAAYVNVSQDVLPWMSLDAGVRYDWHSVAGGEWVPQAGVVVRTGGTGELKLLASKGFRNPTMRELYLYAPANDSLRAERLWNYELGWHQQVRSLSYGFNLFYIKGDNMIQTVDRHNVNTGEVENCGVEVQTDWRVADWLTLSTNHSYLHMEHAVLAAPTYKGVLVGRLHLGRFAAQCGVQYVNGLYTSVGANEQKQSFCLVDASLSYDIAKQIGLWLRVDNLLNQTYQYVEGYPMPGINFMAGININI
ncbi:MAG: TonB-dependent receptor [Bacteroidales bacterium]|nr:TonB-dependent receptor [Bacteroidales bacterium]